jgi:hypothetical protein
VSDDQQEQQERTVERFYTWPNPDGSSTTEYHYTDGTTEQVTDTPGEPPTSVSGPVVLGKGWTEVGYVREDAPPPAPPKPQVNLSAAFRLNPEVLDGIGVSLRRAGEALAAFTPNSKALQALAKFNEQMERQDADEQAKRERALRLVQNRNTGPAPRSHGRRR